MGSVDPLSYPLKVYILVFIVAIAGGLVGYLNKEVERSLGQVFTVILTSSFFGFMCFCICLARGWDMTWTLVSVGMVGVMGKRAVVDFQNIIKIRMGLPPSPPSQSDSGDGKQ
jgi:uncharacterized membrane protein (UPF0136 family)